MELGTLPLISARFLRRCNRFVLECLLGGKKETVYLPNPGRLYELLLPGAQLFLVEQKGNLRLKYRVLGVLKGDTPVLLDTRLTNEVAQKILDAGLIPAFSGYQVSRREIPWGDSRLDFLLKRGKKELLLEVKSCTLFGEKIAMFPDAVSERARRHLLTLKEVSKGVKGAVLFIIHSPHVSFFLPEYHTDPAFAATLFSVKEKVIIRAVKIAWSKEFTSFRFAGEVEIPWKIYEEERVGEVAFVIGWYLPRERTLPKKGGSSFLLPRGHYLFVGVARKFFSGIMTQSRKNISQFQEDLNLLDVMGEYEFCLPLRAIDPLVCTIARELQRFASPVTHGFARTQCSCPSHFFWMKDDPLSSPSFVHLIQYLRMDRIAEKLG